MSETTKRAVLAKCQDYKPMLRKEWCPIEGTDLPLTRYTERGVEHFEIGTSSHYVYLKLDEDAPASSWVWPLAAKILGIEQPKEAARPSDALLWEAFLAASKRFVGVAGVSVLNIKELARDEFDKWLATLPPDTLQADREILIAAIEGGIEYRTGVRISDEGIQAALRLCGKGVGNG